MKEVVSISLGSSKRDHEVEVELLGEKFSIRRIGTDGDFNKAIHLLREMDGEVDAIGLGGIDLYLYAGEKRYLIKDAAKLKGAVSRTPLVDGSGLKNVWEREVVQYLQTERGLNFKGKTVLMVSAVDRFGLAEALAAAGCNMIFGDLIFGLNIPIPIRSYTSFLILARILLPIVTKMPFKMLYPTGSEQEKESRAKYGKYYEEADIVAGDYLFIRKYMPLDMRGKWVLTNTVTPSDVDELRSRGVEYLITTTPEFQGRSFGTNVIEAILVALIGKPWEHIRSTEYLSLMRRLDFEPRVEKLN
ncbi:MAG: quinate 5-dehydrogenase [Actinomycetota bacterium]